MKTQFHILLAIALATLVSSCGEDEFAESHQNSTILSEKSTSSSGENDFRLGYLLGDNGLGRNVGRTNYTTWIGDLENEWSPWGGDNNKWDPDWIRIELDSRTKKHLENLDFRIAVQLADKNGNSQKGSIRYTPWASQGGGWTEWTTDENQHDFDVVRFKIESRRRSGFIIEDMRIGVQLTDDKISPVKEGEIKYTPYLSDGGGWSDYAGDSNFTDPDAIRIKLDVIK